MSKHIQAFFYCEYIGVFYGYLIFIFINVSIPSIDKEEKFLSSKSWSFVLSRVYPSIPRLSQAQELCPILIRVVLHDELEIGILSGLLSIMWPKLMAYAYRS